MTLTPSTDPTFRELFRSLHAELHAYCVRRLAIEDANEAAAEIFLAVWRRRSDMPADIATRMWAYRVATRAVDAWSERSAHRIRLARTEALASARVPGAIQVVRHPHHDAVLRALETLHPTDRTIVTLQAWEKLTIDEVAKVVGLPRRRTVARSARALARLHALLVPAVSGLSGSDEDVLGAVMAANPVPSEESLPTGSLGSGALLRRVDEFATLPGDLTPLDIDRTGGARGALLATLVAAVVLVGVIVVGIAIVSATETLAPDPIPPPTTTTTLAPNALPVGTPPLEVVDALYTRWAEADIDGYRALIDADTADFNVASLEHAAWYGVVSGVTAERRCELGEGRVVTCHTTYVSGLAPGRVLIELPDRFTVRAGKVTRIDLPAEAGLFSVRYDLIALEDYRHWVRQTEPERFDQLFAFGASILLHTPKLRDIHADLMERYRAENDDGEDATGPPVAAIKVVDEFFGLWALDTAVAYADRLALMPLAARARLPTAAELRYIQVTGIALGRICDSGPRHQATCDITFYSGLAPGTEITRRVLRFTVDAGDIVDVESLGPNENVVLADEPGRAQYRAWFESRDEFVPDELFTPNGFLVLDTEAAGTAHRIFIEQFLLERRG